jgi:hypothetical protein
MAADQKNFGYQKYVDDDGTSWNIRSEIGSPAAGVDGHAALDNTLPTWGRTSRVRHPRYVEWTDNTTFRKVRHIIYTAAAYAAIARGDTIAVHVPGNTATVDYTVSAKIGEKQPFANPSRTLADHA